MNYKEIQKREWENKQIILEANRNITENSGIYFLLRKDENGFKFFYVGQARHLLTRLAQHLSNYQHIDVSLRKHGFFDADMNPHGWQVYALEFPLEELDEKEQYYIKKYIDAGWIPRNKTDGGQGKGKLQIAEYKPHKTYRDGILQGKKALSRDLKHILDKHLTIELKAEKKANKTSQKQLEKFMELLNEENYKEVKNENRID